MASIKIETKDSFVWSDDMDFDTYGIILDGEYTNCVIYRTSKRVSYKENEYFYYVIFVNEGNKVFTYIRSEESFRCHVKPLAAGSTITITI